MAEPINLIKLCVGAESVEHLMEWHQDARSRGPDGRIRHVTRMWPKKEEQLLDGGSLFWVIKGVVLARQKILALDEVISADGVRRCAIVLDPELIRTEAMPRRPFQGWRYLIEKDAPKDLPESRANEDALLASLSAALAEIGVV